MTIAMDKPEVEIVASAEAIGGADWQPRGYPALPAVALVGDIGDQLLAQTNALVPVFSQGRAEGYLPASFAAASTQAPRFSRPLSLFQR